MGLSWGLCYEIQKGLCYERQSLADSLRKVCWQYWLNFSHAVTFFSVRNIRFHENRLDDEDLHSDLTTVFETSELLRLVCLEFSGFLEIESSIASYDFCGCIKYDKWW